MIFLDQRKRTLLLTTIGLSSVFVFSCVISRGPASYWKMQRGPNDASTYSGLHYRKGALSLQGNSIINGQLTSLTLFLSAEVVYHKNMLEM